MIKESMKHVSFGIEGFLREFLKPSATNTGMMTQSIKSAIASKVSGQSRPSHVMEDATPKKMNVS